MLPTAHRLRRPAEFSQVVRRGRRASRRLLTVHLLTTPLDGRPTVRVGLVISKAVGASVVRHRVARRLRHLMLDQLADLPAGAQVVLRASPAAAVATSAALGVELDQALASAIRSDRKSRT